jgi:preprotein translocase subunit SecY
VIFASSLLYLPQLYLQFFDPNNLKGYQQWIQNNLADPEHWIYITTYFLLIIFFTTSTSRSRSTRPRSRTT